MTRKCCLKIRFFLEMSHCKTLRGNADPCQHRVKRLGLLWDLLRRKSLLTLSYSSKGYPSLQHSFAAGWHTRPSKNNIKKSPSNVRSQLDGQDNPLRTFHGIFFKGRETLCGQNTAFISDEYERVKSFTWIPGWTCRVPSPPCPLGHSCSGIYLRRLLSELCI